MKAASQQVGLIAAASPRDLDQHSQRLIFANQLRGLAAFSVMLSHLIGVFWAERSVVAAATSSPAQPGDVPSLFWLVAHPWFNFGPFGVAIFFLISGLVIPISLGVHSRPSFLLARILRIYPTYLAALAVDLGVVWAGSRYWGLPFGHSAHTILANALLIQDFLAEPSIDLVNWTLCIELKFYLLMALLASAIRGGSVAALFAVAAGALAFNLAASTPLLASVAAAWPGLIDVVSHESFYVVFMLIGVIFNYRLRGLLSLHALFASVAGLLLLFVACWRSGALAGQYPVVTANYVYALALFGALFMLRRWIRETRPLDALAAVSYPFYLIHGLVGYSLLKVLMLAGGLGYVAALAITVPIVLAVATILHLGVERWSIVVGKRLAVAKPPRLDEPSGLGGVAPVQGLRSHP
jgi:peptidoglycan/LPS O-acetylase OafA/YrhL